MPETMELVREGVLQIPLFHGTPTVNVPSIQQHGLGARGIVKSLRVLECLTEMYAAAVRSIPEDDEDRFLFGDSIEPAVNQRVTGSGMNFKHGATYLTPSKFTATNYA